MEVKLQNLLNWQIYRSCWEKERFLAHLRLAEEVGFEPTDEDHSSTVFKTAAFNRSATLPKENWIIRNFRKLANCLKNEWRRSGRLQPSSDLPIFCQSRLYRIGTWIFIPEFGTLNAVPMIRLLRSWEAESKGPFPDFLMTEAPVTLPPGSTENSTRTTPSIPALLAAFG